MEWVDLLKQYGPWSIGFLAAAYLGRFILTRYDKDIDSRLALANALNANTAVMERNTAVLDRIAGKLDASK